MNCQHKAMQPTDLFCRTCGVSRESLNQDRGKESGEGGGSMAPVQTTALPDFFRSPPPSVALPPASFVEVDPSGIGPGNAAMSCYRCGAKGVGKASAHRYTCSSCGLKAAFGRCPFCSDTIVVPDNLWGRKGRCPNCKRGVGWGSWKWVTLGEYAQILGIDQSRADPSRRDVIGVVIGGSGYPIAAGVDCRLRFASEVIFIDALSAQNKYNRIATAGYSDVVSLQVGGPGVITTGGGWIGGGFGLRGIVEGALTAYALNQLTTRTRIETIVQFSTTTGVLVLMNNRYPPEQLHIMLSPVFHRLEVMRR